MLLLAMTMFFCLQPIHAKAGAPKLNKTQITLLTKKTVVLKVTNAKKKVKWSSSNQRVASVNSKGKVTAKKKGTAKFEHEALNWNGKYLFPIRSQGGNTANVLIGQVEVNPYTGKAIFTEDWSGVKKVWRIF